MPDITKTLSNGHIAVIKEDGSHFEIDPNGAIVNQSAAVPQPSLAQKASQFLQKPSNVLPFSPAPIVQGTKDAGNAYIAADKNYPTENLLPMAGGAIGGYAGANLPIPFAATALAGAGAREGEKLRQAVSSFRNNTPTLPSDESNALANRQGAIAAISELGGSALIKGGRALGRAAIGSDEGFINNFINLIRNKISSGASREELQSLVNKFKDAPIKDTADLKKPIQDFIEQRGGQINMGETTGLTPTQLENLKASGANPSDIVAFSNRVKDLPGEISKLSRGASKPIASQMESFDYSANNPLAKVYNDLGNKDFSNYAGLRNIQHNVGDFAFNSSDRTAQQKFAGKIYHDIGDKLKATAEEGGFLNEHNFIQDEGRKYHQRQFFESLLQDKGVRNLIDESKLNPGTLANKLDIPDEDVQRLFGSKTNMITALKNFSAQVEEGDLSSAIRGRGTTKGGIFGTVNLGKVKTALNMPELLQKIAARKGLGSDVGALLPSKFPYPGISSQLSYPIVKDYFGNENQ